VSRRREVFVMDVADMGEVPVLAHRPLGSSFDLRCVMRGMRKMHPARFLGRTSQSA
jgi:hypothetical protein